MNTKMISAQEAAKILDVSKRRVLKLAEDGLIVGQKIATLGWVFDLELIQDAAKTRNTKPGWPAGRPRKPKSE